MECIKCGACCRQAPCIFGYWDEAKEQCGYLTTDNLCGIYDQIIGVPGAEISPAFGTGCCQPMRHGESCVEANTGDPEELAEGITISERLEANVDHEEPCGCKVTTYGTRIEYCPMHTAAPDMREALEGIIRSAGYENGEALPTFYELRVNRSQLDTARAAFAKAKGDK